MISENNDPNSINEWRIYMKKIDISPKQRKAFLYQVPQIPHITEGFTSRLFGSRMQSTQHTLILEDAWTPAGMLSLNLNDYVTINGSVFNDWNIGPKLIE